MEGVLFFYMFEKNTKEVLKHLEKLTSRGNSHYKVFEDFLNLAVYAFTGNNEKYMEVVGRYNNLYEAGNRDIDHFANALGELMLQMSKTDEELLGEIYMQWNTSNKFMGQFFTPNNVAKLMAGITKPSGMVLDPACGAGIMLVEANRAMRLEDRRNAFFVGQDIDDTCVKMCALNMLFFNMNGYAIQGDSLALQYNYGYRTFNTFAGGEIREMTEDELCRIRPIVEKEIVLRQGVLF